MSQKKNNPQLQLRTVLLLFKVSLARYSLKQTFYLDPSERSRERSFPSSSKACRDEMRGGTRAWPFISLTIRMPLNEKISSLDLSHWIIFSPLAFVKISDLWSFSYAIDGLTLTFHSILACLAIARVKRSSVTGTRMNSPWAVGECQDTHPAPKAEVNVVQRFWLNETRACARTFSKNQL